MPTCGKLSTLEGITIKSAQFKISAIFLSLLNLPSEKIFLLCNLKFLILSSPIINISNSSLISSIALTK